VTLKKYTDTFNRLRMTFMDHPDWLDAVKDFTVKFGLKPGGSTLWTFVSDTLLKHIYFQSAFCHFCSSNPK
jgi:hypothetical protein